MTNENRTLHCGEDPWDLGLQLQNAAEEIQADGIPVIIIDEDDSPAAVMLPAGALDVWMEHLKRLGRS